MRPPMLILERDPRVPATTMPSVPLAQMPFGLAVGDGVRVEHPESGFEGVGSVAFIDRDLPTPTFGPFGDEPRIWLDIIGVPW